MNAEVFLTADLARAARAFTKVSVKMIADAADLSKDQVREFEKGRRALTTEQKARLVESFEKYGAVFLPEEETVGYGVRRKYPREGFMRLNQWEGEGGSA